MGWFGPSQDEVWRQLSEELGAAYIEGGFRRGNKVHAHLGPWTITLDTFSVWNGLFLVPFTRLRVPYINPEGFQFTIYRKGLFSDLGQLLGMQEIAVAAPEF